MQFVYKKSKSDFAYSVKQLLGYDAIPVNEVSEYDLITNKPNNKSNSVIKNEARFPNGNPEPKC